MYFIFGSVKHRVLVMALIMMTMLGLALPFTSAASTMQGPCVIETFNYFPIATVDKVVGSSGSWMVTGSTGGRLINEKTVSFASTLDVRVSGGVSVGTPIIQANAGAELGRAITSSVSDSVAYEYDIPAYSTARVKIVAEYIRYTFDARKSCRNQPPRTTRGNTVLLYSGNLYHTLEFK